MCYKQTNKETNKQTIISAVTTTFSFAENLALFRLTDSKYPFNGYTGSEKAVDGKRKSLSYSGGECFISANSRTYAIWNVDLSYPRGIERIVIYYRTDNFIWGWFFFNKKVNTIKILG